MTDILQHLILTAGATLDYWDFFAAVGIGGLLVLVLVAGSE